MPHQKNGITFEKAAIIKPLYITYVTYAVSAKEELPFFAQWIMTSKLVLTMLTFATKPGRVSIHVYIIQHWMCS